MLTVGLDSGPQYISSRPVNSPSRRYEPFLVSGGSIESAIPSPAGPPIIGDWTFILAESEARKWRDKFSHETPRRRPIELYALFPGESIDYLDPLASPPVTRPPFFTGEIVDAVFQPDRTIRITGRDRAYAWLDEPFPALITADIYPGLDPRYEGQYLPIVAGEVRTPGIDDSPPTAIRKGQIALPRMSPSRWGIAAHPVAGYRVFRRTNTVVPQSPPPDLTVEEFLEVDPAQYVESLIPVSAFNLSMNHTVIDFLVDQPEDTELFADIDGIDFRGAWGPLGAVGYDHLASPPSGTPGARLNPMDFYIAMTLAMTAKAGVSVDVFDVDDIAALREKFEVGFGSPPIVPRCDGNIKQPITPREWLGQFQTCFNLDNWQKRNGKISLSFTDQEDPDRLVFTETSHILKQTFQERLPEKPINQIQYRFQYNSAEDKFGKWGLLDSAEQDVLAIGLEPKVEKEVVDLLFVRDPDTAFFMMSKRAEFQSLGSYQQEWEMPLPEVPVSLEPSSLIGVTHEDGLEIGGYINREVKVLGLVHSLDALRTRVRCILRSPQIVYEGGLLPFSYPGGPKYYGDTCGTAPFNKEPAYGGTGPWAFTLFSGTLPPGSTLDASTGVIASTHFTVPGIYHPVIKMVDAAGRVGMIKLTFDLTECLAILACPTEQPVVGEFYGFTFTATGGFPGHYLWDIYAGSLPPGLTLNQFSGDIAGWPTALSTDPFTIRVRDQALHNPQEALITCSFEEPETCTPWLTDVNVDSLNLQGIAVDDNYVYTGKYTGPSDPVISRIDKSDGTLIDTLTIPRLYSTGSPTALLLSLATDGTYLYAALSDSHAGNESTARIVRIDQATFTIVDSVVLSYSAAEASTNQVRQMKIAGGYIYAVVRGAESPTVYSIKRVLLSDFTTLQSVNFTPGADGFDYITVDSTHVYASGFDGSEAANEFTVYRCTVSPFAYVDRLQVAVDQSVDSNDLYLPIANDSGSVFVGYQTSSGPFTSGVAKITKSGFTLDSYQTYPDDNPTYARYFDNMTGMSIDGTDIYIYGRSGDLTAAIGRTSTADVSIFDIQKLTDYGNEVRDMQPIIDSNGALIFSLDHSSHRSVQQMCEFTPD